MSKWRVWSPEEIMIVKKIYPNSSATEVTKLLPTRNVTSIRALAKRLKIKSLSRKYWTSDEEQKFKRIYATTPIKTLCKDFHRSYASIADKARSLGLKSNFAIYGSVWTPQQDALLQQLYPTNRAKDLQASIGHTTGALYQRAKLLKVKSIRETHDTRRYSDYTPRQQYAKWEQLSIADRAYVAGLIDGEGTIVLMPRREVSIANTNKDVMDYLLSTLGGHVRIAYRGNDVWKDLYTWHIGGGIQCLYFLRIISPYLIIKRSKAAQLIIEETKKEK